MLHVLTECEMQVPGLEMYKQRCDKETNENYLQVDYTCVQCKFNIDSYMGRGERFKVNILKLFMIGTKTEILSSICMVLISRHYVWFRWTAVLEIIVSE